MILRGAQRKTGHSTDRFFVFSHSLGQDQFALSGGLQTVKLA
jgi:hypothetical protein